MYRFLLPMVVLLVAMADSAGQGRKVIAFPGAEGFGMHASGGRGGDVYAVTTLDDSGPGSLRDAVSVANRIIIFRVSGNIEMKSSLSIAQPNITVAGQSAPGGGVCVKDYGIAINADNVIVRYLRCRPGDVSETEVDSLSVSGGTNVILDHCSASWSVDETLSVTGNTTGDVTVQWCLITESLHDSCHVKGPHGMGSLLRPHGAQLSFHHNLYAHHNSRNPRPGTYEKATLVLDFRNNVIYDWGATAGYSGGEGEFVNMNYVGNSLRSGPSTRESSRGIAFASGSADTHIYLLDNVINGDDTGWGMVTGAVTKADAPFPVAPVKTEAADVAFAKVLQEAGASLPKRDAVDMRIIEDVRNGTGGIINSQDEVGGWPALHGGEAPADSDGDGMPDAWERYQGLDPEDAADGRVDRDGDGYTNIEEYLNGSTP